MRAARPSGLACKSEMVVVLCKERGGGCSERQPAGPASDGITITCGGTALGEGVLLFSKGHERTGRRLRLSARRRSTESPVAVGQGDAVGPRALHFRNGVVLDHAKGGPRVAASNLLPREHPNSTACLYRDVLLLSPFPRCVCSPSRYSTCLRMNSKCSTVHTLFARPLLHPSPPSLSTLRQPGQDPLRRPFDGCNLQYCSSISTQLYTLQTAPTQPMPSSHHYITLLDRTR